MKMRRSEDSRIGTEAGKTGSPEGRPAPADPEPDLRTLLELFLAFLKLGLFTVGGGYAMIPQMQQLACEDHGWLTREEVVDCIAIAQSLPGVIAVNMATYIGRRVAGFAGAAAATVGVVIPSFVIICLAVLVLGAIGDNPWIAGAFRGVKAGVCGLILVSAVRLGRQVLDQPLQWILMVGALVCVGVFGVTAIWVILAGGMIGILYTLIRNRRGNLGGQGSPKDQDGPEDRKGADR